jgi:hypothetical protein
MANMSYCKYENTYHDLQDALNTICDKAENDRDERYRLRLIQLIEDAQDIIADQYEPIDKYGLR